MLFETASIKPTYCMKLRGKGVEHADLPSPKGEFKQLGNIISLLAHGYMILEFLVLIFQHLMLGCAIKQ